MSTQTPNTIPFQIESPNPPNKGILFVNNQQHGRSGHLGHALVQYAPGQVLAFFANCSDVTNGHNGDGWMEYRRSTDGGQTWQDATALPYSKEVHSAGGGRSVLCEKAVLADDGTIVLFNYECANIPERKFQWMPIGVPTRLLSSDQGHTWSAPAPVGEDAGRIYDAIIHEGIIYALEFVNDAMEDWSGTQPDHHYSLLVSTDHGRSFSKRSVLPFDAIDRGYGAMTILPDGSLIAYVYNLKDEFHLETVTSKDGGHTWSEVGKSKAPKQIRNQQVTKFQGRYVLHGRSGNFGDDAIKGNLIVYTSTDGIHWDDGIFLIKCEHGMGAYSNSLVVDQPDGSQRLLIQASHAYDRHLVNVFHWWLK